MRRASWYGWRHLVFNQQGSSSKERSHATGLEQGFSALQDIISFSWLASTALKRACIWLLASAYDIVHSNNKHVGQLSPQAKSSKQFGLPLRRRLLGIQQFITTWGTLVPWLAQSRFRTGDIYLAIKARGIADREARWASHLCNYLEAIRPFVFATNNLLRSSFNRDVLMVTFSPDIESSEIDWNVQRNGAIRLNHQM